MGYCYLLWHLLKVWPLSHTVLSTSVYIKLCSLSCSVYCSVFTRAIHLSLSTPSLCCHSLGAVLSSQDQCAWVFISYSVYYNIHPLTTFVSLTTMHLTKKKVYFSQFQRVSVSSDGEGKAEQLSSRRWWCVADTAFIIGNKNAVIIARTRDWVYSSKTYLSNQLLPMRPYLPTMPWPLKLGTLAVGTRTENNFLADFRFKPHYVLNILCLWRITRILPCLLKPDHYS